MPTEDDARRLLEKAAATIDVDDTAPMTLTGLPEPRPHRWPVLAAAAAVVLAIGGGYLVAQQFGDDHQPAPPIDQTDAADREPVEQVYVSPPTRCRRCSATPRTRPSSCSSRVAIPYRLRPSTAATSRLVMSSYRPRPGHLDAGGRRGARAHYGRARRMCAVPERGTLGSRCSNWLGSPAFRSVPRFVTASASPSARGSTSG